MSIIGAPFLETPMDIETFNKFVEGRPDKYKIREDLTGERFVEKFTPEKLSKARF